MSRSILALSIAASALFALPVQAQLKTLRCVLPNKGGPSPLQWELSLNESQRQVVRTVLKSGATSSFPATFTAKDVFFTDQLVLPDKYLPGVKVNYQLNRTNGALFSSVVVTNAEPTSQAGTCKPVATPSRLF